MAILGMKKVDFILDFHWSKRVKTFLNMFLPVIVVIVYEQYLAIKSGSRLAIIPLLILYSIDISVYFGFSKIIENQLLSRTLRNLRVILVIFALMHSYPLFNWLGQAISGFLITGKFTYPTTAYSNYLFRGIWIAGFASSNAFYNYGIFQFRQKEKNLIEKRQVEREREALRYAYLKAQIRPHLLFNSLNFVYAKIINVSTEASEAVYLINELMKYAIRDPQPNGKVLLSDEVEQIENYLALIKLQMAPGQFLDIQIAPEILATKQEIYPYLLVTLIENVFKHGKFSEEINPTTIVLKCIEQKLSLHTFNLKATTARPGTSVGSKFVSTILELEYPGRYLFEVCETEVSYELNLEIEL